MSDSNTARKAATRKANASPSHYQQSRAYAKMGAQDSMNKFAQIGGNAPENRGQAAVLAARVGLAGAKSYGKSAYHAGMGMMEGFMKQNPNDGRQLSNMKISQALSQGRNAQNSGNKGIEGMKSRAANSQANAALTSNNKGIESARQQAAAKQAGAAAAQAGKSSNQGISSYRSKSGGQSSAGAASGGGQGRGGGQSAGSGQGR